MIRKLTYLSLLMVIAIGSCKKDNSATVANKPVVISYLLAGHPATVKVYQQKAFSETAVYGALIGGLKLQLSNGVQTVNLTEITTGTYTYIDSAFLETGKTYTLQFAYNNNTVTATTLIPETTSGYIASRTNFSILYSGTIEERSAVAVRFSWNNPDSLYHALVFKFDEANTYANASGNLPSNFTIDTKKAEAVDITYRQFRYAGFYSVILFTVNKEYSEILTSNTNTSSQRLDNPPGNIKNGYGIFTGMQADTIRLKLTY